MNDGCEIRVHPTGKVLARISSQTQGQGHETTYAQIIAEELGFPVQDIKIEYGDTDTAPYGLGTYGSRSTPTSGAATSMASRKILAKSRTLAAHLLEASEEDLEWEPGKFCVKGSPDRFKTIQDIAFAAYTNFPQGMEMGLEAVDYYDPPNLTFPFGSYICVVDIDKGTGQVKVRRFVAIDDCGNIINPMIVDGQIHGGLNMGLAPALYEQITYDELGNNQAGTFMDYLVPTAVEIAGLGDGQDDDPIAASPDRREGRRRVGHGRRAAGDRERGRRCAVAPRRPQHRHPDHAPEGLGDPARERASARRPLMAPRSIFARAADARGGRVGRSRSPRSWRSSGRPRRGPGASGIVHPDGTIEGWVGGSCAQPVVVREALRSLGDGQPRLLRLSKDVPAEGRRGDGVIELVMTCHSGGTLEIYVEPHLPAPVLWVAGTTPIAGSLVALGSAAGWRVTLIDPVADADAFPGAERVVGDGRHQAARPGARAVRRGRDAGRLGRGGRRRRARPRRLVCRAGRLADPRQRRSDVAARGGGPPR